MLELDLRSHCFDFLMVNSVTRMKWHSHCRRLYIMTSTVSLCLSMKMINDLSVYDMLVHIRPFFIKYVAAAIRISYDVLL